MWLGSSSALEDQKILIKSLVSNTLTNGICVVIVFP